MFGGNVLYLEKLQDGGKELHVPSLGSFTTQVLHGIVSDPRRPDLCPMICHGKSSELNLWSFYFECLQPSTPLKTNMHPENHWFVEENGL